MAFSYHKILMVFILGSMAAIGIQSILQIVYAQDTGVSVLRRVEIWSLFYRLMVAAFMVSAGCSRSLYSMLLGDFENQIKGTEIFLILPLPLLLKLEVIPSGS